MKKLGCCGSGTISLGEVVLECVCLYLLVADIFMKPLDKGKFELLREYGFG